MSTYNPDYRNYDLDTEPFPNCLEIRRWAELRGLPVQWTGKLPRGLIKVWDQHHPDRPYVQGQNYHGTGNGYGLHGCRCERCAAWCHTHQHARWVLDQEERS